MGQIEDFLETNVRSLLSPELEELALKIVTGDDGLDRTISRPRVQKPGLAFAEFLLDPPPNAALQSSQCATSPATCS